MKIDNMVTFASENCQERKWVFDELFLMVAMEIFLVIAKEHFFFQNI